MKSYKGLTGKEIVNLGEEGVKDLIDLQCAEEGIKIARRPVEPEEPKLQRDIVCYKIGDMIFKTQSGAQRVFDILRTIVVFETDYNWEVGSDYKYLKEDSSYGAEMTIVKTAYLSKKRYKEYKEMLKKHNDKKEDYEHKYEIWSKENEKRLATETKVREHIRRVFEREQEKEDMLNQYKRYLELSDNNKEIAKRFLCDAYGAGHVKEMLGKEYWLKAEKK